MKSQKQLNRMIRRNQIEYFEEWFAEVRGSLRQMGCTNFEEMATSFRNISIASFPESVEAIDMAISRSRTATSEGSEPAGNPVKKALDSWLGVVAPGLLQ